MTVRKLAREYRDFPATFSFCVIWIVVYAAMTNSELAAGSPFLTPWRWLVSGLADAGDRFGDLTLEKLGQGQFWRLITCNFVHYSLVHLVLNVLAMYQLGTMVEQWYGSSRFVFVSSVLGGGGNLVSALIRHGIGSNPEVHSGGGSVLIMGLVGLCAVAAWRVRDRWGKLLSRLMMLFLALTALSGILLPTYIDNWGHAGGALVGAALGLADRRLLRNRSRPSAWGSGVVAGLIIAGCGAAQFLEDRHEAPIRLERVLLRRSDLLGRAEWDLNLIARTARRRGHLTGATKRLADYERVLDRPIRQEFERLRPLVAAEQVHPLSDPEWRELMEQLANAVRAVRRAHQLDQNQLQQLRRRR